MEPCVMRPATDKHEWLWEKLLPGDEDHYPGAVYKCRHCGQTETRLPESITHRLELNQRCRQIVESRHSHKESPHA
jgi:hypothetical protein